jgi:ATP-dependent DNA ligase
VKRNLICHDPGRNSHKFWRIEVVGTEHRLEWGRVGTNGQRLTKTFSSPAEAIRAGHAIIDEKIAKGYVDVAGATQSNVPAPAPAAPAPSTMPSSLRPMLAEEVDADTALPRYAADDRYIFEPKVDGQRIMLQVGGGNVIAIGRNGQTSQHNPRFQDRRHVADMTKLAKMGTVVLDGELVGDKLWLFDMPSLEWKGGIDMVFDANEPWHIRRRALGLMFRAWSPNPNLFGLLNYAEGEEDKLELAKDLLDRHCEGVIIKNADAPYRWGRRCSDTLKAKFWKSADLIVTAVGTGGKANAELAAILNGALVPVGRCSLNGKGAVTAGMVVEVKYLYLGPGDRLVQPDLLRIRTDKSGTECTFDQLVRTNKEVLA